MPHRTTQCMLFLFLTKTVLGTTTWVTSEIAIWESTNNRIIIKNSALRNWLVEKHCFTNPEISIET